MHTFASLVSQYWWTLVLRGLVAILFGILAFVWPGVTLSVLVLLFGAYALVDGIAAVMMGVREYGDRERWWATMLAGIAGVAAGIITFVMPGITAIALLAVIAFWAIAIGAFEIMAAIRLRHEIEGEWLLALGGVLSIAFGALMLFFPGAGALAVVWWIGAFALVHGAVLTMLGFRLRGVARLIRTPH
ncbi:MAG TPA: HdeD family acid-resistance protein [Vicinamibacterales bacterium]|nr:HdeD family acid-resistance protein [Vicinamibacterales bacterium]